MKYYIYMITNMINYKKYIGMRSYNGEIEKDVYMGSGILIKNAILKYGVENFKKEILEICTKENISEREQYYINKFDAVRDKNYYNLANGGRGGKVLQNYPKGEKHHWYKKQHTSESKDKIRGANKGKKRSKEFCEKLSEINKGKVMSEETKLKLSKSLKGRKFTEEHKMNLSKSNKITKLKIREDILVTQECVICKKLITNTPSQISITCSKECFKILQSKNSSGENNGMFGKHITEKCRNIISKKIIVALDNGEEISFNSQKECSEYFSVGMTTVSAWKRGERQTYMKEHGILKIKGV